MARTKIMDYLTKAFKTHGHGHATPDAFIHAVMHTPSDFLGGLTPHTYLNNSDLAEEEETEDYVLEVLKILYQ